METINTFVKLWERAARHMEPLHKNPIELMRIGVDYKFKIKLNQFILTLRPLSALETITIENDVIEQLLKMKTHQQTEINKSLLFANKTLMQASTSAPGKSDYQISELVLQNCTPDEVMFLFNEYIKCTEKVNPSLETMPMEELTKLVEEAKKNSFPLTGLSFWQLENLCRALINEIAQQDKLSGGQSIVSSTET